MTATLRRVAVTGARGFVGSALTESLTRDGIEVVPLVRRQAKSGEISWDPEAGRLDPHSFEGIDGVVHLAGESIAGFWTAAKKRRIMESRVRGTRLLASALATLESPPGIFVSTSGVGYYGEGGDTVLREDSPAGDDFLARVCAAWEESAQPAADAGIRVVHPRFGLVLDRSGGALRMMLPAFRFGLGARLGDGRQWLSWIALNDAVRVLRFALDTATLAGPVNAVAPEPVRNEEFTRALARAVRRPALFSVPKFALRAFTAGMADALLLTSQRAVPAVLLHLGFAFGQPMIDGALAAGARGSG